MTQRYIFQQLSGSKITGRNDKVTRWVTTWHDRATVYTLTEFVDADGFILDEGDPAVAEFLATEKQKLAEFSAVANKKGISAALVAVPEVR